MPAARKLTHALALLCLLFTSCTPVVPTPQDTPRPTPQGDHTPSTTGPLPGPSPTQVAQQRTDEPYWTHLYPIAVKDKGQYGQRYGYIDRTGKVVIEPQFDFAWYFDEGLAPAYVAGRAGYIGPDGKFVIQPRFAHTCPFQEGRAMVVTEVTEMPTPTSRSSEGKFRVKRALIDRSGKILFSWNDEAEASFGMFPSPCPYRWINMFVQGKMCIRGTDVQGVVDREGNFSKEPCPPILGKPQPRPGYEPDLLPVAEGGYSADRRYPLDGDCVSGLQGRVGYANRDGKWAIPPSFDVGCPFAEGLAIVEFYDTATGDEKLGFIDRQGNLAINPRFYVAAGVLRTRTEGCAESWQSIPCSFAPNWPGREGGYFGFYRGLAYVCEGWPGSGVCGYIDHDGRWVWKEQG